MRRDDVARGDDVSRVDDVSIAHDLKIVIPAQGVAGVSDRLWSTRETVMAYSPWSALQGGIQRLSLTDGQRVTAWLLFDPY